MLIILRENIANLGSVGDVLKVSDGYARNYLLPRNLAFLADETKLSILEHRKRLLEKKRLVQKAHRQELAQKVAGYTVELQRKVAEGEKIFGSVTAANIVEVLAKAGFEIERSMVLLDAPIRSLGSHTVVIRWDADVFANVQVSVTKDLS